MNNQEFIEYMKEKKGDYRKGQFEFYSRTLDFMKGDKKFLINPAGMGLGKTLPTTTIISKFLDAYDLIFIANPTSPLKYIWVENLQDVGLLDRSALWPSKREVCIKKQLSKDRDFSLSNCNDDCIYQRKCKEGGDYNSECKEDYERYMNMGKNATPLKYYGRMIKTNNINLTDHVKNNRTFPFNCLYAPTRMGLRDLYDKRGTRKIIIGDYNGFLMPGMFTRVTNEMPGIQDSLLIIDEGHLINIRARSHYSTSIYLNRDLSKLEQEFKDYKHELDEDNQEYLTIFIEHLKEMIIKYNVLKNKIEYGYLEFKKDFTRDEKVLGRIIISLNKLWKIISEDKDNEEQKNTSEKLYEYLTSLKKNSHKEEYVCSIQESKYYQNKDIKLECICIDPSEDLKILFEAWDKVIINTGTLPKTEKIVLSEIGIDEGDCAYEKFIKSYDLSDYIFILPEGKFNSTKREETYKENKDNLIKVLKKVSGKTLIFIQSKQDSLKLNEILSKDFKIINFCQDENNQAEVSAEDFSKIKSKFVNHKGKCVGIINIYGRVEGHNFTDDDSIPQVKNVIIYGFSRPPTDDLQKAREKLYIKKYGDENNEEKILSHVFLIEPIQKIQQACYRCKRDNESKPIIILWGSRFSPYKELYLYPVNKLGRKIWRTISKDNNIFHNLPLDFIKNIGNYNELIKFIEKREDGRADITD